MKRIRNLLAALAFCWVAGTGVARADPVTAAITAVLTTVGVSASVAAAAATFATRFLVTAGLSLLQQALNRQPKAVAAGGIKTDTSTGGATSRTFMFGDFATGGQMACPLMSFGSDGETPNAYLTYVIACGTKRGQVLKGLMLADDYAEIGALTNFPGTAIQCYGFNGSFANNAWLRWYDGSQTTADPLLIAKLSNYPERPWSTDMIGKGCPYIVLVLKYNRELYNGAPRVRPVWGGIPCYDPRFDSSVGGSGPQRWATPSTWVPSKNPIVQIYNILRGIMLEDGSRWGGEADASDLPLDNWFAGMNACDEQVQGESGLETAYEAGIEVSVEDEPAGIIEALLTACNGQIVEIGGVYKVRVGGPGLPVYFFNDLDILINRDQNRDMFPGLSELHNGIQGKYPEPNSLWESSDAPALFNEDWEDDDDNRRLVANLTYAAVSRVTQVQRLMKGAVSEERRFGRHALVLGPYASMIEPLDSVAWTSEREGYTNKVFEVTELTDEFRSINVALSLRERDANDFVPPSEYLPAVPGLAGLPPRAPQAVPGFNALPDAIKDSGGVPRKPAIKLVWNGIGLLDVSGIMWEIRLASSGLVMASGTAANVAANALIVSEGLIADTDYHARASLVADRPTEWTAWVPVRTPDIKINLDDLAADVLNTLNTPFDELLKTNLRLGLFEMRQEALNFDGAGRSLQVVSKKAEVLAADAAERMDLLAVFNEDRSAVVWRSDVVQVVPGKTMSAYMNEVSTSVLGVSAAVEEVAMSIDGIRAQKYIKVRAGNQLAGIYADADDEIGTSTIGLVAENFFFASNADPTKVVFPVKFSNNKLVLGEGGTIQFAGSILVGDENQAVFVEEDRPDVPMLSTAMHGMREPYINDTNSRTSDVENEQRFVKMVEFFNNRPDKPINQRIKSGPVYICAWGHSSVDTHLSLWSQVINANETIAETITWRDQGVDNAGGVGDTSVNAFFTVNVPVGGRVALYLSVNQQNKTPSSGVRSFENASMTATASNF